MTRTPCAICVLAMTLIAGCFPTLHTPRIERGFHLDGGATFIADQRRNDRTQGHDYMAYINPSFGFAERFEIGLPVGIYLEEGLGSLGSEGDTYGTSVREFSVWPYIKVGFTEPDARDQLAFTLQSAFVLPANAGLTWSRSFEKIEPMLGASVIFSSGTAGDDPAVTRYQEADQIMFAAHGGAVLHVTSKPTLVIGLLHNRYKESAGDVGQQTIRRTLWDVYVGLRFRLF